MKFVPYLNFEGNAEEALNFYADALNAEIAFIMRYDESPSGSGMPPTPDDYMHKILHATLNVNGEQLYFSDTFPGSKVTTGDSITININCDTEKELRSFFDKLLVDGSVSMPVDSMFWGSIFGSLTDKYGIAWCFNYDLPK